MVQGMKRLSQFKLTKGLKLLFTFGVTSLLYSSLPDYYDLLHVQAQPQLQQQPPLPILGVKITSPVAGQVPVGQLTISGISTDNATSDCTVYADWNNTKPFQKALATGPGGANDYSTWTFTYTDRYHLITNGTNDLTSKLSCINNNSGDTANLTKYYSFNVIGVNLRDSRINANANYTIPPIVKVPSHPIIVEATSQTGSLVNYNVSATDNMDMLVVPICDPPSGSIFLLGRTTVKCTAIDNDGNAAAASFPVIVNKPTATTTTFTIIENGTYSEAANVLEVAATNINTCNKNLAISNNAVEASGSEIENPPSNVVDNDLGTRWSNLGVGSWIQIDLGAQKTVCDVDIAWYRGDERQYSFVISVSSDGTTFSNMYEGTSSGKTSSSERYSFSKLSTTRYLKITVNGNTDVDNDEKNWAAITEIAIDGDDVNSTENEPFSSPNTIILNISGVYEQSSVSSGTGGLKIDPSTIEGTIAIINSTSNKKIDEFDLAPISIMVTQLSKKITITTQLDDPITSGTVNATLKFKSSVDFKNNGSYTSTATSSNIFISKIDGKTYDTKGTAEGKIIINVT
jgi:hypothetical protein